MSECPFCHEPISEDLLSAMLADQRARWDRKHEPRPPHPDTMAGKK